MSTSSITVWFTVDTADMKNIDWIFRVISATQSVY